MPYQTPRFSVRTLQQTHIDGGFTITITTDVACHLWLRQTPEPPQKHLIPVLQRGIYLHSDAYHCFVAYDDLEQNEPDDTTTHTFTWTGWKECMVKYFYFWGSIGLETSVSTTGYWKKHYWPYPKTSIFHPDLNVGGDSVDGWVGRRNVIPHENWEDIRDGLGNDHDPIGAGYGYLITASSTTDKWSSLFRFIHIYNTTPLPNDAIILGATVDIYVSNKVDDLNIRPDIALTFSFPWDYNDLIDADYANIGWRLLADPIPYDSISPPCWITFEVYKDELMMIRRDTRTKLGLKNWNYDILNVAPNWTFRKHSYLAIECAESGIGMKPTLTVVWTKKPPPGL